MNMNHQRTWNYYGGPIKGHLGLQLMTSMAGEHDRKPFISRPDPTLMVGANGASYHHNHRETIVSEPHVVPMDYIRNSWMSQRDKFLNMLPGNAIYSSLPESSTAHNPIQMIQQSDLSKDERVNRVHDASVKRDHSPKKRDGNGSLNTPKPKRPRKAPSVSKANGNSTVQQAKGAKKNVDVYINGYPMDLSGIPIPVCSCTGNSQQCYRWGSGGWQSACCTTSISMYPLPMSSKRRGARIAGRKMSQGAFKKVLERLAAEGHNFTNPIDLRSYWAKHGTNKFVTIR
ncbi:GAGA-binding transcriptional activator [Dillenia turbinata]|uniref:GAGA-binding transcriptional activator n=1 Tax=Dillenia turbinata TaxID=194707 RepID=A0AAN8VPU9_9MAGN